MSELHIYPVKNEADMMDFISFPWEVYRDNPYWVPPLISERRGFHNADHNPFFEHAQVEYYLARRGSKVVGTIASFTNEKYNQFQGVNTGFFGFFEVLNDEEAAAALLRTAEDWAKDAGHDTILGPAQFSTNDEVGLLVDSFDDAPRVLMTYNPPRYVDYIEQAGFQKSMDLWAYALQIKDFMQNIPPKLIRVVEKIKKRHKFVIRPLNMRDFDHEVELFKRVYNKSWERNWGFVPMTDAEINHLAQELKQIIDPELAFMVEQDGEVVGVSLSLPDLNQPLRRAYPKPDKPEMLTMLKLIWHWKVRRQVDWLRVFALGVMPEFRGLGIDALMYIETARKASAKGYKWVEMSWILENNEMMNRAIHLLGGEVYKTYRMYEKQL
ncbi:MAG: N-acetyltransferase [Chloroflexi bacterium]|nr:N-acetyltransferase [Chloroflexota bacterium]